MDVTVNGKWVTLRDRLSARDGWPVVLISSKVAQEKTISFDDQVTVMRKVVESWEFDGSPQDAKSYEALDLWAEFSPLSELVAAQVISMRNESKNWIRPPISE